MIIAKQKKEENIAEYLLYMWQIEDILRAYNLDIEKIDEVIVSQYQKDENTKKEIRDWYDNLIQMMKLEHLENSGHLQININLINDLNDLHMELLQNPQEIQYNALFFKTLPFLVEFRGKLNVGAEVNDIELSLHSLYAILLLKLQGKEISKDTGVAIKQISSLLAVLSLKYKHWLEKEPQ
jgi:hypothetical protein